MKISRTPFYIFIFILIVLGVAASVHRHVENKIPWLPGEKKQIWSIEAKIEFQAHGEPIKISLAIPDSQDGFTRMGEHTASAGYGLSYIENPASRRAEWSIRSAVNQQILYYRVDMLVDGNQGQSDTVIEPVIDQRLIVGDDPYITSALAILEQAQKRSADAKTLTRELIREFNAQIQSTRFLEQKMPLSDWLVLLLQDSNVPVRKVQALTLEDGRRRQSLVNYLQVFTSEGYLLFHPENGRVRDTSSLLLWEYNSQPLIDIIGGTQSQVSFSIIKQEVPISAQEVQSLLPGVSLFDFSIHSLPLEEQAVFKGLLLIPVGVLVVVFMRVFIGLRTSGTFMPILIAIAFIQTSLTVGIIGFVLVVSLGLLIRGYLSRLNLLLVARISAVIISVIMLIAAFSAIAYKLGLSEGLKITFFPMIILSWTIERMSILWEEEGGAEVFAQTSGSLIVALVTYMLMMNDVVRHLTFNFLGLQLVFMAFVLMMGNYTGYRLLEFRRFGPLAGADVKASPSEDEKLDTQTSGKERQ